MGILQDVLQIKAQERERELADISQISGAVNNFIDARQQTINANKASELAELQRRNIESQISTREEGLKLKREGQPFQEELLKGKLADSRLKQREAQLAGLLSGDISGKIPPSNIGDFVKPEIEAPAISAGIRTSEQQAIGNDLSKDVPTSLSGNNDFVLKSIKAGGYNVENVRADIDKHISTKSIDESTKRVADFMKTNKNFGRVVSVFTTLVSQLRGKEEEQGGLGLGPGLYGVINTKLKRPGFGRTKSFDSQKEETILALGPILTNQNRFLESAANMIRGTLPGSFDPSDMSAQQLAQSITNSYKLIVAEQRNLFTPEEIDDYIRLGSEEDGINKMISKLDNAITMTPQEEELLEIVVNRVLSTPPATVRDLPKLNTVKQKRETQKSIKSLSDKEIDEEIRRLESGGL